MICILNKGILFSKKAPQTGAGFVSQLLFAALLVWMVLVRFAKKKSGVSLAVKGAHSIRAYADDADWNLQLMLKETEVGFEVGGKLGGVGDGSKVGVPAGEGNVFGGDGGEFARVGEVGGAFAGGGAVVGAGLDFGEGIENVGFHEVELGDAV